MISEKRLEFIRTLKKDYPEMKVHYFNQVTKSSWGSEKLLKDLTDEELEQFNLRKTRPNEIIFDVEDQESANKIKEKLQNHQWIYEMWWTGSRGFHFSVLFENLAEVDLELRNRIRKYYISEIGTDDALSKESQYLALEYTPHFKTEKEKYLFDKWTCSPNRNIIEDNVIEYCKKEIELNTKETKAIGIEEFKDFDKNDPFLLYMLNNTINDGERNNIVFKNLAIGLVLSGADDERIQKIATRVVNNCPGKTMGEFMGWIGKAKRGELLDYNKAEITRWATKYSHPIFYNLLEEVNLENMMGVYELWDLMWNYEISSQPIWKDMCFYNLVSTVLQEKDEDLRIHPIFTCDSTAGKDEGLNLVRETLNKLGFVTYKPATVTDKTLIGGVNQVQVEINTKKGEQSDKWKDPREYGILKDADWVGFGESDSVFNPKAFNQSLHIILRQVMDKSRTIEKGVAGLMLELYSNATFAFVTYPIPGIMNKLVNNGLFQRALYYDSRIPDDIHKIIRKHMNRKNFDPTYTKHYDKAKFIQLFCEKLKRMRQWYMENRNSMLGAKAYIEGHYNYTEKLQDEYEEKYNILSEDEGRTLY